MPRLYVDVTFGRDSSDPVMYALPLDKVNKPVQETNLFVLISDRLPRRLGGDGWKEDPVTGETNSGWLYHGTMKIYPKGRTTNYLLPETNVAVKWVRGQCAIESLRKEARLYDDVLRPLQGTVVPTFYGLFTSRHDGVDIGCMLLEWCPGNDPVGTGKPTADVLRMRSLAVQSLHQVGVYHNQLYDRSDALCVSDGRHFLQAVSGTIRIVDFQHARMHRCKGEHEERDEIEESLQSAEDYKELAFAMGHGRRAFGEEPSKPVAWNMF